VWHFLTSKKGVATGRKDSQEGPAQGLPTLLRRWLEEHGAPGYRRSERPMRESLSLQNPKKPTTQLGGRGQAPQ
jgi:hypothetical protein